MQPNSTISVADFAAAQGVTVQAVHKALRTGRIRREADGGLDPVRAAADWERNRRRPGRRPADPPGTGLPLLDGQPLSAPTEGSGRAADTAPEPGDVDVELAAAALEEGRLPSIVQSQAVREAYRAKAERLRYEQQAGQLVKVENVKRVWYEQLRGLRDRLLLLPERLAPLLAAETETAAVRRALETELRSTLEDLTEEPPGV